MPLPKPHRKRVKHFVDPLLPQLPAVPLEWFAGNADFTSY